MTPATVWRNLSLGVFCLAVGALVYLDLPWKWIFVVVAGMSLVRALVSARWRWAPHPLLWGLGLGWAYAGGFSGWVMFWWLCGGSVILAFLISLVPRRPPPARAGPPPRPGDGVVLDAEVTDSRPAE